MVLLEIILGLKITLTTKGNVLELIIMKIFYLKMFYGASLKGLFPVSQLTLPITKLKNVSNN